MSGSGRKDPDPDTQPCCHARLGASILKLTFSTVPYLPNECNILIQLATITGDGHLRAVPGREGGGDPEEVQGHHQECAGPAQRCPVQHIWPGD